MKDTEENIRKQLRTASAAYTGPVTKCHAGKRRGKVVRFIKRDAGDRWLTTHPSDLPVKDENAERRRLRIARAERERIAIRNATIRRRIGEVRR